ncbi:hypothetical protein J8281_08095 [Aquimarina sp. U1-2]|uniref:hypothetical protein n=1 Tax=Aquimarina sp. U1-2 TaxID=2823141 RepID=UPI001AED0BC4|nr:hypothetical protein [Aquimarina sp. U1-2]MBP2832147.1 hypothetical protein [Aquimarina sp. U1-2]
MKILSFLFFVFIFFQVSGQSQLFKGKIIADSLQGYAINIINFNKEIGTTNDEYGIFEIPAAVGDSIVFSSVQYQIQSLIVDKDLLNNKKFVIVLKPLVQELEKVNISTIELSGFLDKDSKAIKVQPFVDSKTLGLPFGNTPQPTLAERRLHTAKTSASGIPLDFIINTISGRLRILKRNKRLEDMQTTIQKGEKSFATVFFVDSLKVPENLISDFIYYCAEDDTFEELLQHQQKLYLLEFLQKKSKRYRLYKALN